MNEYLREKETLKRMLSEKRYCHSLGVAEEAEKLAKMYGADPQKAYLAGLLHDCAKELSPEESVKKLTKDYGFQADAVSLAMPTLLHGLLGAAMAQNLFDVKDSEIFDAIRYHTTGKADMPLLTKVLYVADYIEPGRTYPGVEDLRDLAYRDLEKAILFAVDFTICDLVKKGKLIHPDTLWCRNDILKQQEKQN